MVKKKSLKLQNKFQSKLISKVILFVINIQ